MSSSVIRLLLQVDTTTTTTTPIYDPVMAHSESLTLGYLGLFLLGLIAGFLLAR